MIQRIQTVYLVLAVLLSVVFLGLRIGTFSIDGLTVAHEYNLLVLMMDNGSDTELKFTTAPLFVIVLLSAVLGAYSIFAYRNRILQARFCMFNVLLLLGWDILYAVYSHILIDGGGRTVDFSMSWTAAIPTVALILYLLARRGIMADERLVRAADRIR